MKTLILLLAIFINFGALAVEKELTAEQLESLSDCDYFKFKECSGAGLTIGACIKKKYNKFVSACGKIHADKFIYSREVFKPEVAKNKKKGESCEAAQERLCQKTGISLSECARNNKKEMQAACGDKMTKAAAKTGDLEVCYKLRKKYCAKGIDPDCDANFQAAAPAHCKEREVSAKKGASGEASDKIMLDDCMKNISSACKLDENELTKDGVDVGEYMRKYRVCVKRSLKTAKGKCGAHTQKNPNLEKEIDAIKKSGK